MAKLPHHAWLEIDLAQLSDNIRQTKHLIAPSQLCAVMKADAYGLGIEHLLPTIIAHEIPYIAIASTKEAATIRSFQQPRYTGRILRIRTATADEIHSAIAYQVEEMIGHIDNANLINRCGAAVDTIIPFHLKLNSAGMGRNGLDLNSDKGKAQALAILQLPYLRLVGIMTHFPKESVADIDACLQRFLVDCDWLIAQGKLKRETLCIHAANSYAGLAHKGTHLDMVRPGSLLYGDGFSPDFEGFPHIVTFKSTIASINEYPAGSSVSYEREHILQRDSKIATVLVGYADGYRRIFSHKGSMLIKQQHAPVVGRVSMNVTTVDVTDIADARIGDEVVIFGHQGLRAITQIEMENINQALFADLYSIWGQCNPKILVG